MNAEKNPPCLSATSVGLMTAAAMVTSLRGLPLLAKEEMTMFAYLAFAIVFYLLPASLVSAELGGAFSDRKGGIYAWVGEAFGKRWGFLAVWLQWIQNVVWFPVGLTFGAAALAYTIGRPDLAKNGTFVGVFCIVVFWVATAVVLRGVQVFARLANWTFIAGTIVPGLFLLVLLAYWVSTGHPIGWRHLTDPAVSSDNHATFLPSIHGLGGVSFLAGIVLLFAGVEVQAVHVIEMREPGRDYPLAICIGALAALFIFALGAIPIAAILPRDEISLQSGVFDTFSAVITDGWHMGGLTRALSLLVGLGAISGIFAWLNSPSKGLLATAQDGNLPQVLQATNSRGMPRHILLAQGVVVTLMSSIYFLIENVSVVFFLLSATTIALYLIAYMFMYAAAIKLRYSRPELTRAFRVPGGDIGMWAVAGIGFVGVLFSFMVAFFPPDQLPIGSPALYTGLVLVGTLVFCAVPLLMRIPASGESSQAPPDLHTMSGSTLPD